ncbi:MAG: DUF58 domain-containing protein [Vicinamibacteraceae bacterium]
MSDRLAPPPATGIGGRAHRVAAGVGGRAFGLLGIGLLWLIPAAVDRRALVGLVAWDLFVVALWVLDLRRLPVPSQLRVTRDWAEPLGLGRPLTVGLTLEHEGRLVIEAQLADAPSTTLRRDVPEVSVTAWPGRPVRTEYAVLPTERGDTAIGPVTVRYESPWRLATRWARVSIEQTVRVYPDLRAAQHHVLHLVRSQSMVAERRRARQHGAGREFERLRDYRDGDDRRDVCWTATARRGTLVTRLYRPERSQAVWILLDGSRLLRARAGDRTKLDAAVDAALALAHVAQASGDRIGLVAYGRRVHARLAPDRGARHLRRVLEVLAQARAEAVEGDHAAAAAALLRTQQQRSLIVWLTDLAETAGVPEVIECASQMAERHLVLCAMLRQMDVAALAETSPATTTDLYRVLAAQEVLDRRETLLRGLRRRGALALDLPPGEVASAVVQRYLAIKERNTI